MQFSKIKKQILSFVAPSLRPRLDLYATVDRHFHDGEARVWMTLNGKIFFKAEDLRFTFEADRRYALAKNRLPEKPERIKLEIFQSDWFNTSRALYKQIERELEQEGWHANYDVQQDLLLYPKLSIEEALTHPHAFIRGFALLDRRVGKRRLERVTCDTPFELTCLKIRLETEVN
ncbi:hypothetical protein [Exiguobacterium sp. 17-1]|uniref:SF0329 family protein n=1 Tax=Exiguobacterium sp. 17-1 TaxID=2931981 RepID=UPI001FFFA950|nr:hypothetical protein [Exiguobacterium sp. 17-1]MCK2158689.1 hypothetical protein [Exiguobacterium sp. 17-1]